MYLELVVIFLIFVLSYTLILKNFKIAVYLLLILSILLHKELFSFYRWDLMPIRAFMLALLCVGVTKVYFWLFRTKKKDKLKELNVLKDPFIVLVALLWLVRGISIVFSKNLQSSLLLLGFFTTVVVLVIFLINFLRNNPDYITKYLKFYIFITFGLTLFGYYQYYLYETTGVIIGSFWNIPGNIARVGATFWDVNHYGALLASLLPIAGIFMLYEKSFKGKALFGLISISLLITLFLTNSRTAWLIDGVAALVFAIVFLIRKFGVKSLTYLFLGLILITIPFVREYSIKDSRFRAEIKQYFHYRMDSFDSHIMLLTGSFQIFAKYPILGGGYGGFFEHFSQTEIAPTFFGRDPAAFSTRVPAHTIWGELLAETGIIGFSIWVLLTVLLLVVLLKAAFKTKDWEKFMISAGMFSIVIGWFTGGLFYSYNSEFFWIVLSLFFSYGISILGSEYNLNTLVDWISKSKKLIPVLLITLSIALVFWGLNTNHLVPWDESIYAKISKNMVINNEYITQEWKPGLAWYEKPPLYMWLMAGFMHVFGFTSIAAKLPSAIFGFLTLLVVYNFGKKLFNKTSAFLAAFSLLTTIHFLYYSRQAMTDVTNLFFITFGLFMYWLAKDSGKFKYWIFSGVSIGLAVMTKGVIGLIPFAIIGIYELYLFITKEQKLDAWLVKRYITLFITSLVIFLPWHLEMYRRFGDMFVGQYLGYHVIARATEAIEDKGQPWWWYFVVMKVSMRIWFIALLSSLPWVIYNLFNFNHEKKKRDSSDIKEQNKFVFILIWSLFILVFFSIAKSKLVWYILPIYPVLSLVVGRFIERVLNYFMERFTLFNSRIFKFLGVYVLVIFSLMYLFYNKELAYPSDLTGPQARLLQLKDTIVGTEDTFYIDRIELPLVMFYTDSPFEIIDYQPEKGRIPVIDYKQDFIILSKRGRFELEIPILRGQKEILGEELDWVLFRVDSEYSLDKDSLKSIRASLANPLLSPAEVSRLKTEEETILQRMDSFNVIIPD